MYRCQICPNVSQPGQTRLIHRVKRPNGSTAREISVCPTCHAKLEAGFTVRLLVLQEKRKQEEEAQIDALLESDGPAAPPKPKPKPLDPPPTKPRRAHREPSVIEHQ